MDTVLAFRDSKHTNVKQQVMLLIPKMSEFAPEKFVLSYLEPCTAHLLSVIASRSPATGIAFQAFGQMIAPLAAPTSCRELQRRLQPRLADIEKEIGEALAVRSTRENTKRNTCVEAITCVAVMAEVRATAPTSCIHRLQSPCDLAGAPGAQSVSASRLAHAKLLCTLQAHTTSTHDTEMGAWLQAFGALWEPAFQRLLKPMVLTGLSAPLTKALQRVARKLPPTVPAIRQHLLLPVLTALPVTVDQPDAASASNGVSSAPLVISSAMGQTVAKHRDLGAHTRGQALARVCFHVRSSLLKPNLADFAKQVHAQVRACRFGHHARCRASVSCNSVVPAGTFMAICRTCALGNNVACSTAWAYRSPCCC